MHTHNHALLSTLQNHLHVSVAAGRKPLDPSALPPPPAPQPFFLGACSLSTSHSDLLSGRQVTKLPPRRAAARFPLPEHHPPPPSPAPLLSFTPGTCHLLSEDAALSRRGPAWGCNSTRARVQGEERCLRAGRCNYPAGLVLIHTPLCVSSQTLVTNSKPRTRLAVGRKPAQSRKAGSDSGLPLPRIISFKYF